MKRFVSVLLALALSNITPLLAAEFADARLVRVADAPDYEPLSIRPLALPSSVLQSSPLRAIPLPSYNFAWQGTDNIAVGTTALPATTGTISLWVKTGAAFDNATYSAFFRVNTGSDQFQIATVSGSWYTGWATGGVNYHVDTASQVLVAMSPWTNVIETWNDTTNQLKLYINGVQAGATTTSLVTHTTSGVRYIGTTGNASPGSRVAKVAIWNTVISGADILALGGGTTCETAVSAGNRVNYWPLATDASDSWGSDTGTVNGPALDSTDNPNCGVPPPTTYYVDDATGNDARSCATASDISTPKKTNSAGVACAFAGDTVDIRGGTYTGTLNQINSAATTVRGGSSWANPITIQAHAGETVTIQPGAAGGGGNAITLTSGTQQYLIFDRLILDGTGMGSFAGGLYQGAGSAHIRFQNGRVTNAPGQGINTSPDASDIQILTSRIDHNGGNTTPHTHGIYVTSGNNLIDGNELDHNASNGFVAYNSPSGADNNIICGNFFHDNAVYSESEATLGGDNNQFCNNVVAGAGTGYGLDVEFATPTDNWVYNNTFVKANAIRVGPDATGTLLTNNIVRLANNAGAGTIDPSTSVGTVELTNTTSDPSFTNAGGSFALVSDFTIPSTSVAKDAGTTLASAVPTDLIGTPRPQFAAYDIGAYEYFNNALPCAATGIIELSTANVIRPVPTASEVAGFVPATRTAFCFPPPYTSTGYRITIPSDGTVNHIGYSQWANLNNSTGSDTLYMFAGLVTGGATLFSLTKSTHTITKLDAIFNSSPAKFQSGEGFFFSHLSTRPTRLYFNESGGSQIKYVDVLTHAETVVGDIATQTGIFGTPRGLTEVHMSGDDNVFSFTVYDANDFTALGCGVYRVSDTSWKYYPGLGFEFLGCLPDKSGTYVYAADRTVSVSGPVEDRVFRLSDDHEEDFTGSTCCGHMDTGYTKYIHVDNGCCAYKAIQVVDMTVAPLANGPLIYRTLNTFDDMHPSFINAIDAPLTNQYFVNGTVKETNTAQSNEIYAVKTDASLTTLIIAPAMTITDAAETYELTPFANVDPTGRYVIWSSNMGTYGGPLAVFLAEIPNVSGFTTPTIPPTTPTFPPGGNPGLPIKIADATIHEGTARIALKHDGQGVTGWAALVDGRRRTLKLTKGSTTGAGLFTFSGSTTFVPGEHVMQVFPIYGGAGGDGPLSVPFTSALRRRSRPLFAVGRPLWK